MKWMIPICALGMVAVFSVSSPAALSAQAPAISGTWAINQDESDDLQEVMRMRGAGQDAPRPRRGMSNAPRIGRDAGSDRENLTPEQRQVGQVMTQLFREGGERLAIAQTDSTLTVLVDGRSHTYYVDERKAPGVLAGGVEVEVKAKWDKEKFKVETKGPGNAKVTQEIELDDDTGRLKVKTKLSNSRMGQNFTLERVYDPAS